MIWATVSSQSCFCWLYWASPSMAAKSIINLISVLAFWCCPCVEPCVVGRGCLLWLVLFLGKTLLAFALLHFVLQGQICLLLQVSFDFLLLHYSPLRWNRHRVCVCVCVCVLVLENLVCLHRTLQVQLLSIGWGIGLNYCDAEWFALETNRDHLSFLRLHPSTAFWTVLLTMMATPFLLRDSCPP